jgi:hypothetical protein
METTKLTCEKCGCEFDRENKYLKHHRRQPSVVIFKWKVKYCDSCYDQRVKKAFKDMPEIIKRLAE